MRATGSRFSRRLSFVECRLELIQIKGCGAVAIVAVRVAALQAGAYRCNVRESILECVAS